MTKKKTETVKIDDVIYEFDDFSNEQKSMIYHIRDIDRKLLEVRFTMDQLSVGRDAFTTMLTKSLEESKAEAA